MIIQGDALSALKTLPAESVQCCVTSPPYYGLRDYGADGQIGLEDTPEKFISALADVFDEVKRVLKPSGILWVNIGDSYAGSGKGAWENKDGQKEVYVPDSNSPQVKMKNTWEGIKPKDLIGIPWMLAFELRRRGWYLRQDIIWHKPNPMPESVTDRCTKSHEYIFLLSKSQKYYFDYEAIQEDAIWKGDKRNGGGSIAYNGKRTAKGTLAQQSFVTVSDKRNKRDVWSVPTKPYSGAHFATYPEELIKPCVLAGSKKGDTVLDPFNGAATTGVVCLKNEREYIGIELNLEYVKLSESRLSDVKEQIENEKAQYSIFDIET